MHLHDGRGGGVGVRVRGDHDRILAAHLQLHAAVRTDLAVYRPAHSRQAVDITAATVAPRRRRRLRPSPCDAMAAGGSLSSSSASTRR